MKKTRNLLTAIILTVAMAFAPMQVVATQAAVTAEKCRCSEAAERIKREFPEIGNVRILFTDTVMFIRQSQVRAIKQVIPGKNPVRFLEQFEVKNLTEELREGLKKSVFLFNYSEKTTRIIILECDKCGKLFVVPDPSKKDNGSGSGTGTDTGSSNSGNTSGGNSGNGGSSSDKPNNPDSGSGNENNKPEQKPEEKPENPKPTEPSQPSNPEEPLKKFENTSDWITGTNVIYNTLEQLPTFNFPEGVKASWRILDSEGKEVTGAKDAGNYTIRVSFEVPEGYEPVPDMTVDFVINKAQINLGNLSLSDKKVTYDPNSDYGLYVGDDLPEELLFDHYLVNGQVMAEDYTVNKAGSYSVEPVFKLKDADNHEIVGNLSATLTIEKSNYDTSNVAFEYDGDELEKGADGDIVMSILFDQDNMDGYNMIKVIEESTPEGLDFSHYLVDGEEQNDDYVIMTPGKHVIEAVFDQEDSENYNKVEPVKTILDLRYGFNMTLNAEEDDEGHLIVKIGIANIEQSGLGLMDLLFTVEHSAGLEYQYNESDFEVESEWEENDEYYNPANGKIVVSAPYDDEADDFVFINKDTGICTIVFDIDDNATDIGLSVTVDSASYILNEEYDMINAVAEEVSTVIRPTAQATALLEEDSEKLEVETEPKTVAMTSGSAIAVVEE